MFFIRHPSSSWSSAELTVGQSWSPSSRVLQPTSQFRANSTKLKDHIQSIIAVRRARPQWQPRNDLRAKVKKPNLQRNGGANVSCKTNCCYFSTTLHLKNKAPLKLSPPVSNLTSHLTVFFIFYFPCVFPGQEEDGRKVLVLSYSQYCRYCSVLARLRGQPSSLLIDHTVLALGGIAALGGSTRILYCRDTFEHPTLLQNESICDEFGEQISYIVLARHEMPASITCWCWWFTASGVLHVAPRETSNSSCPGLPQCNHALKNYSSQHGSSQTFNYVISVAPTICSSLLLVANGRCLQAI